MYDVALSVAAFVRTNTRADIAWMVSPQVSDQAVVFTPGGGRVGSLWNSAFDGMLADVANRQLSHGRYVEHVVTDLEAEVSGLASGTVVSFIVIPASQFPAGTWQWAIEREPLILAARREGSEITNFSVQSVFDRDESANDIDVNRSHSEITDESVTTVLVPIPRLVIAGQGPMAAALAAQGELLGWKVTTESRGDLIAGITATLSPMDAVVVMGHDVESSSRHLMLALESQAGYIGALGSRRMQEDRADWLAYRDVTDLSRVDGPAGIDIGAQSPSEVAVSVVAAIIAARHTSA